MKSKQTNRNETPDYTPLFPLNCLNRSENGALTLYCFENTFF